MKSTEFLSILALLGCAQASQHYPGVRFVSDLQYMDEDYNDYGSLAAAGTSQETSQETSFSDADVEQWIQRPQFLTEQQVMGFAHHMDSLNQDPEKVFGASQPLGVFNTHYNGNVGLVDDTFDKQPLDENVAIESDMSLDELQTFKYLTKQHKKFIQSEFM